MAERITKAIWSLGVWRDTNGQDMLEYALYAAAVCMLYAAVSPSVATSVSTVFSKINTTMIPATNTGG
jgi:pilus assembly protein Flp/PilA